MPVSGRMESGRPQIHHHPTGGSEPSATGVYDPGPPSKPITHPGQNMNLSHYSAHQMQPSNNLPFMQRFYSQHSSATNPSMSYYQHLQNSGIASNSRMSCESNQSYSSTQLQPKLASDTRFESVSTPYTESSQLISTQKSIPSMHPSFYENKNTSQGKSTIGSSQYKAKHEECSDTPSGQKLTYLMQQALQTDALTQVSDKLQDKPLNIHISTSSNNISEQIKDASTHQLTSEKSCCDLSNKTFNDDVVHSNTTGTSGSQKNSPHSMRTTPGREIDSPMSTEPPSLPSERANSHCLSDSKYPESLANVLELSELETTPVSSTENQQFTPTTGTLSIPSQSDRTENNNVLIEKEPVEDADNEICESPTTKSSADRTPVLTPDHSFREQSASMLSLDVTIESVLDKIRTGRGKEVEFTPCSRQEKEQQIKAQQMIKKQSSATSTPEHHMVFSSHPTSPRTPAGHSLSPASSSPGTNSSAYVHQRQRMNSSLEHTSSSMYMQPGNSNNSPYSQHALQRHLPGQISQHSPSAMYMTPQAHHQVPMSKPMFPSQNYPPSHPNTGGMLARRQPQPHSSLYNMHSSLYPQHMSMQPQHYVATPSNMHMGNFSMGQQPPNYIIQSQPRPSMQMASNTSPRQPYYSNTPVQCMSPVGPPMSMHRAPPSPNNMPPPSPLVASSQAHINYSAQEQKVTTSFSGTPGYYGNDGNLQYITSDSNSGPLINNCPVQPMSPLQQQKQNAHCSQMAYPPPHRMGSPIHGNYTCPTVQPLQQSCYPRHSANSPVYPQNTLMQPPNQMMMMPPPSIANPHNNVNALTSRKRPVVSGLKMPFGPSSKRKRSDMLLYSSDSSCHGSREEILERLHLQNFCSILQDPMVTPSLSVLPPKGGIFLGKIINSKEPEKESYDIINKPKKYSLAPYQPKHVKPLSVTVCNSESDSFIMENMPKSVVSVIHNGPYLDVPEFRMRDSSTPDNPVPTTPPISEPYNNAESLLAIFNQPSSSQFSDRSRVSTPPIQFIYPLIVQTRFHPLISNDQNASDTSPVTKSFLNNSRECCNTSVHLNSQSANMIDSETGEVLERPESNSTQDLHETPVHTSSLVNGEGEKLHLTFTLNAAMAGNVPKVVRGFTDMLGIDFRAVDYEVTRASNVNVFPKESTNNTMKKEVVENSHQLNKVHESSENPSNISRETTPEACFRLNVDKYNESVVTVSSLIASQKQVYCKRCEMVVADWKGVKSKVTDSDCANSKANDNIFCSLTCLSLHTNKLENHETNMLSSLSTENKAKTECSPQLYTGETTSSVPVLLKGPIPKHTKSGLKRQYNQDHTFLRPQNLTSVRCGVKRWREVLWRRYDSVSMTPVRFYKDLSQAEVSALLARFSLSMRPSDSKDSRCCRLCKGIGDSPEEIGGRLLNLDANEWLHINCALWCYNVYETVSGALVDVDLTSYPRAENTLCVLCHRYGAGLPCYRSRCQAVYHLPCAVSAGCMFFTDRGMYCPQHKLKDHPLYLPTLKAKRRIYIERDETIQLANVSAAEDRPQNIVFRIGTLIVHRIGHLTPHLIATGNFHTSTCIYPVGYKATRIHWSIASINQRNRYHCSIEEQNDHPLFVITYLKEDNTVDRHEGTSCDAVWKPILGKIAALRAQSDLIRLYPQHIQGEDLFGLTEPHVVRSVESLPHVNSFSSYVFRYGGMFNLHDSEMPVIVNPSGSARSEPKEQLQLNHKNARWTSPRFANPITNYSVQTNSVSRTFTHSPYNLYTTFEHTPYSKHNLQNKIQQFRRLADLGEWRLNVQLAKSNICGLGLFSRRDLEKHTMVVEYKGENVRNEVANCREIRYKKENRREIYFFRVNEEQVLDATFFGSCARYIRHSCEPNLTAEVITIDGTSHILMVASKRIDAGHELTYNYKLDSHYSLLKSHQGSLRKMTCLCGAPTCKKWII